MLDQEIRLSDPKIDRRRRIQDQNDIVPIPINWKSLGCVILYTLVNEVHRGDFIYIY